MMLRTKIHKITMANLDTCYSLQAKLIKSEEQLKIAK